MVEAVGTKVGVARPERGGSPALGGGIGDAHLVLGCGRTLYACAVLGGAGCPGSTKRQERVRHNRARSADRAASKERAAARFRFSEGPRGAEAWGIGGRLGAGCQNPGAVPAQHYPLPLTGRF